MSDLDRAYVINGDDLRHALGSVNTGNSPRAEAERILRQIEVTGATAVSEKQLAGALDHFRLGIHSDKGGGDGRGNLLVTQGTVADPEIVAQVLYAQLSANAAHENEQDPWAEAPVDAHICCEHVLGSLASDELDVMDKIAGLLRHRSERSRRRVLNWAKDFLLDLAEPPF